MKNKYGNFVVLKMLTKCDPEDQQSIMKSFIKNVNSIPNVRCRNRWIKFIEENPFKVSTNNVKTNRPSQFRNDADAFSKDASEVHSPMTADEWKNLRQAAVRRNSRELKEEKSLFYHENKGFTSQSNSKNSLEEYNHEKDRQNPKNTQTSYYKEQGKNHNEYEKFEKKQYNHNGNLQKEQVSTPNGTKKPKSYNQKFYVEKSQNNKRGYNYFH